jgi:nitrile hydratase beta subunit
VNGVHDMGGMANLGPLEPEENEPVFHAPWEGRVFAMTIASPTRVNLDYGRHQRELIPGPDYLPMTYYERWFRSLSDALVRRGFVTPEELESGRAAARSAGVTPRTAAEIITGLSSRGSYQRERSTTPLFAVGAPVRARNINPAGHTRLPRYVRGHLGVIERCHGAHVFPDSNARLAGEDPQFLYSVRFTGAELWGEGAESGLSVALDLWEPYLEPA